MTTIVTYIRETWPEAAQTVESVLNKAYDVTVNDMILGAPTQFSKQIDDLARRTLPPTAAKVAAMAIVAVPFMAVASLAPPAITAVVQFVFLAGKLYYTSVEPTLHTTGRRDYLHPYAVQDGLACAGVLMGIVHVAHGIFGGTLCKVLSGAAEVLGGLASLLYSDFLSSASGTAEGLYEELSIAASRAVARCRELICRQ